MPFGRYRNELLEDVPSDYLTWVLREAKAADAWLKAKIRDELDRRNGRQDDDDPFGPTNGRAEARGPPDGVGAVLRAVVKRWFALGARQYHPDRAADDGKAMAVVNNLRELLDQVIDEELKKR
jgi:hypothetical protein